MTVKCVYTINRIKCNKVKRQYRYSAFTKQMK